MKLKVMSIGRHLNTLIQLFNFRHEIDIYWGHFVEISIFLFLHNFARSFSELNSID
jgi:hypothetical protein